MSDSDDDEVIPEAYRPDQDMFDFDLAGALDAVVAVHSQIASDAFTASMLGTERHGSGVVIDQSGLIVTIGYLVTEAEQIWITTNRGVAVEGHVLAYDQASGFGLVQPMGRLGTRHLRLGSTDDLIAEDPVILAAAGGIGSALGTQIIGRRPFAGYWEYLLEDALFTAPAHPNWGGAGCIDEQGALIGIGSLLIQAVSEEGDHDGNMIVPIEELLNRLDDLVMKGRVDKAPRPWLGMFAMDSEEGVGVTGLVTNGPAHKAGIQVDDRILAVAGAPVEDLADFYRKVWSLGEAGVEVPLTLQGSLQTRDLVIVSEDRNDYLKKPTMH